MQNSRYFKFSCIKWHLFRGAIFLFAIVGKLDILHAEKSIYLLLKTQPDSTTFYKRILPPLETQVRLERAGIAGIEIREISANSNGLDDLRDQMLLAVNQNKGIKKVFLMHGLGAPIVREIFQSLNWYESLCPVNLLNDFGTNDVESFLENYTAKISEISKELSRKQVELNIIYLGGGIVLKQIEAQLGFCGKAFAGRMNLENPGFSAERIVNQISASSYVIYSPLFVSMFLDYNKNNLKDASKLKEKVFEMMLPAL